MTAPIDARPERIAAELERRYPGTSVWWGRSTRNWWALARDRMGRHRLVEATTPGMLGRRLDELVVRPPAPQPVPRYSRDRLPPARPAPKPAPTRPAEPRHRRPARRGWLRSLVAT